jgi:hypothetical protein
MLLVMCVEYCSLLKTKLITIVCMSKDKMKILTLIILIIVFLLVLAYAFVHPFFEELAASAKITN